MKMSNLVVTGLMAVIHVADVEQPEKWNIACKLTEDSLAYQFFMLPKQEGTHGLIRVYIEKEGDVVKRCSTIYGIKGITETPESYIIELENKYKTR